jgi:hypothetical protein
MLNICSTPAICRYFYGLKILQQRPILAEGGVDTVPSN